MNHVEEMADRLLMINRGEQALYGAVKEVRQRFALDAVLIEGEGNWASLPGVERVEDSDESHQGELVYLQPGMSSARLLQELAARPDMQVHKFELAVPSLNEIFIRVVEHGNGRAAEIGRKELTHA
jgi:ABC-2 type transport system ATP-binding protein